MKCLLLSACLLLAVRVPAQTPSAGRVQFNFEQVELQNLVSLVGTHTGKRFVQDTTLTGRVSVITRELLPIEEVFPLFVSVLEGSGYTVVERDDVYHIRALPPDDPLQAPVVGPGQTVTQSGLITRVLLLNHIRAHDVRPVLEPMVRRSRAGSLLAFGPTNHLIITDTASNIARIEALLAELDKPGQSGSIAVLPLQHAEARDLAEQISLALRGAESAGSQVGRHVQQVVTGAGALPASFTIVPASHANALIVSASPVQMREIAEMVRELDVPPGASLSGGRLHAVFLNYLSSEAAARQLTDLLAKRPPENGKIPISVQADVANNAVLVDATPSDFATIEQLLRQLDLPPQQVLVEVLIVEIAQNATLDLGVEWATTEAPQDGTTTIIGRSRPGETDDIMNLVSSAAFPQGLSFGVANGLIQNADGSVTPQIPFLLRAAAGDRDVNILSNVPLRTQNNTKASVRVVENIPILKSVIEGGTGDNRDVIQNIERIDVGIQLTITPQVNPNREITLQLNPVIEAVIGAATGDAALTPTIARREVTSTITVKERSTVIISGLLREDTVIEESRVPILGSIPLVGMLFRSSSERVQKTNLMILVTPYIVTDSAEADQAQTRWEQRTGIASDGKPLPAPDAAPED